MCRGIRKLKSQHIILLGRQFLVNEKHRFPTPALLVLVVGLGAVAAALFLSSPILRATTTVNSFEQAKGLADQYLAGWGPDLRVAEIMEFANNFYVIVRERSTGVNAFELLVDRYTGRVMPEPGPNMMWNTKYGMMGFRGTPTANMPISASKASEYAQRWLDSNLLGAEVEEAETFYGYYTIDVSKGGGTYGMLSVNGYSGEVWYHTWHGTFITEAEYD